MDNDQYREGDEDDITERRLMDEADVEITIRMVGDNVTVFDSRSGTEYTIEEDTGDRDDDGERESSTAGGSTGDYDDALDGIDVEGAKQRLLQKRLRPLQSKLDELIAEEKYEDAARLMRDEPVLRLHEALQTAIKEENYESALRIQKELDDVVTEPSDPISL